MTGPLAQIVALTCYGNGMLGGQPRPGFFPGNSTCRFCDWIRFAETRKPLLRKPREVVVAATPDEWLALLPRRGAEGLRLVRTAGEDPRISDRMSAGFVGGGGHWMMEVVLAGGQSEFWSARWEVGDKEAPEKRIWRVTYRRVGTYRTRGYQGRALDAVARDLQVSLEAIRAFAVKEKCASFAQMFGEALRALADPGAEIGYHKDLALPGQLAPGAASLLKAAQSAWVFGGMGSWNDLGFEGLAQQEYEIVSDSLFNVLNEAIEVAASSSWPQRS